MTRESLTAVDDARRKVRRLSRFTDEALMLRPDDAPVLQAYPSDGVSLETPDEGSEYRARVEAAFRKPEVIEPVRVR